LCRLDAARPRGALPRVSAPWRTALVAHLAGAASMQRAGGPERAVATLFSLGQMEEEGVPSTALREVSLLQMLSESIFVVRCVCGGGAAGLLRAVVRLSKMTALGALVRSASPARAANLSPRA
jgi:hypothetical protein